MKNVFLLLAFACIFSCNDDTNEMTPPVLTESFEYTGTEGASFSTTDVEMHYDSIQQTTFIKYTEDQLKLRANFKGRQEGIYDAENAIF